MIENSANKKIENSETKDLKSEAEAVEFDFHFSGGGEYFPMTVKANSREKAMEVWQQKRVPYQK